MKTLIEKLRAELDLTSADVDLAVAQLLSDQVDDELKVDFLTALHQKSETAEEIVAFVQSLMKRAINPMIDPSPINADMIVEA